MLLHNKRIEGSLMGLGYQNPYALDDHLHPIYLQPLRHKDYVRNLKLVSEDYIDRVDTRIKEELKEQAGQMKEQEQSGGAIDIQATAETIHKIYKGLKTVAKFYSSSTGTKIKNFYGKRINPHPNWRPSFVGENHMILQGTVASFLGPGTHIQERIRRGDPPLDGSNGLDAQARIHDIDYMNAKNLGDVRVADKKLIKNLKQSTGNKIVKKLAIGSIKGKMKAEDLGLLDRNYFSKIEVVDTEDTDLVGEGIKDKSKKKLKKVKPMGKYPDSYIRQKLLKQYKSSKKKLINKIK